MAAFQNRVSRREALKAATVAAVAGAAGAGVVASLDRLPHVPLAPSVEPFEGLHQQGITTPAPLHVAIVGFDVLTRSRDDLVSVLRAWSTAARSLADAPGSRITFTFGFGPTLFQPAALGLSDRLPPSLVPLPPFAGDAIDDAASHGDLCVQVCAADADTAHHGVRAMVNAARPIARLRWKQTGFRAEGAATDPTGLFGFRDGTANLDPTDPAQAARHLWVDAPGSWLHHGTYLVVRRIRLLLDTWDRTSPAEQQQLIGRRKDTNERLPPTGSSHVELASPDHNAGATLLRRSYSYDAGVDPNGLQDAGLIFISYQRDPLAQFVPVMGRLSQLDGLRAFSQHVATAVFAVPAGPTPDGFVGQDLFR